MHAACSTPEFLHLIHQLGQLRKVEYYIKFVFADLILCKKGRGIFAIVNPSNKSEILPLSNLKEIEITAISLVRSKSIKNQIMLLIVDFPYLILLG